MQQDQLFERLWNGTAQMEEWTQAVSEGAITSVSENIIAVHTTYLCGSVTVIRTAAGLVFVDTAKPDTAAKTLAADPALGRQPHPHRDLHAWPYRPHQRYHGHRPGSRHQGHPAAACHRA